MNKTLYIFLSLILSNSILYSQETYNSVIYKGLDAIVDSVLTQEQADHLKEEAELLLIFHEVNKLPCSNSVVYTLVESEDGRPVKKFNLTLEDYKGTYSYSSQHANENAAIWISETYSGLGKYKITIHKKNKISSSDNIAVFLLKNEECDFIFQKIILAD